MSPLILVGVGSLASEEGKRIFLRSDPEEGGRGIRQAARNPDFRNADPSAQVRPVSQKEARLGQFESDGQIGTDHLAGRGTVVGIQAGREIQGDDGASGVVDEPDPGGGRIPRRTGKSGAQQSVHDEAVRSEVIRSQIPPHGDG